MQALPNKIIDMHAHIAGIGAGNSGCFIAKHIRHNWRLGFYLHGFNVTLQEVEEHGDMLIADRMSSLLAQSRYISQAVVLAQDGVVNRNGALDTAHTAVYVPNEFVIKVVNKYPNFLFGASINPYRKDAIVQLDLAKKHKAILVKWIPSIMNIDPADKKIIPFYKRLVELNLPLLTHTGYEESFPVVNNSLCDPEKLNLPLSLNVKVIAAHVASTGKYNNESGFDRLARLMLRYSNLYSDISSLTQMNKLGSMKKALNRHEFNNKLLYGSDFPLINTPLVSPWHYMGRLRIKKIMKINSLKNPWDIDVKIKQELGAPADVFIRFERLFMFP